MEAGRHEAQGRHETNVRVEGGGLYRDERGQLIREGRTYTDGFFYNTEPDELVCGHIELAGGGCATIGCENEQRE